MDDSRTILAIGRIEQAIGRIERAVQGRSTAQGDLAAPHERLRRAAADTLRDLDELIGKAG